MLLRLLTALLALSALPALAATDLQWPLPDGARLVLVPQGNVFRLERRAADGRLDPRFGAGGTLAFTLGADNEAPAVLRADAAGRVWVAGSSEAGPDGARAVVLRFSADGRPDAGFGPGGRSSVAPGGLEARASELLPLDDGAALVAGTVIDGQGHERAALWRLRADGALDARFAPWLDRGPGATETAGLLRTPAGEFALGLQRAEGARSRLEVWTWSEGAAPQRRLETDPEAGRGEPPRLGWQDGRWTWDGAPAEPEPAPPAEAPAAALATPFTRAPAAQPETPPAGSPWEPSTGWWLLLPLAAAGLGWWWRWGRRRDAGPGDARGG